MIEYYGDFLRGATLRIPLNSLLSSGALTAITSPAVAVVRGGSVLTPSGGVSLSGSAGVYEVVVDTSVDPATFVKGDYSLRLSAGTVNGVSVAGYWLAAFSLENRSVAPQTGDAYARIGAAGAGLTAIGPVTLASSQPNYAPATAAALASLVTTVGAAGAGLTGLPPVTLATSQPNYAAAKESTLAGLVATVGTNGNGLTAIPDPAGVGTLLTRLTSTRAGYLDSIPSLATASQIPADFTDALFASAGVFSSGAMVNVPASGGGPVQLDATQPYYAPATASALASVASAVSSLASEVGDAGDGLTNLPAVTLAASQPGYAPATAAALASLASTVGTAGDGLTAIPRDGYRLAADGLDAIATAEPTVADDGPMSTWTFPQLLRWLVARFGRASKTPTALTVSTLAGSPSTVQALTDDGAGNESTGAPS